LVINNFTFIIIFFFSTYILIFLFKKFKILNDNNFFIHKNFINKSKPPVAGGIIILLAILLINQNYLLKLIIFLFFLLGIFSDLLIIKKSSQRIIIQTVLIISYIIISNVSVQNINLKIFDIFLQNKIFSLIFTLICLLVLVNGSNFIDGVNNLLSGYYLIVISLVIYIFIEKNIKIDFDYYYYLLVSLSVFYIFNMFNKIYLGDSGSYILSFFIGILLINLSNTNVSNISPLFVTLLLWYPAFENLFSIIRKSFQGRKIYKPDNSHLHHVIFCFFKKKFKIKNLTLASSLTGNVINSYNLLMFVIGLNFINSSGYLIMIIALNIFVYILTYLSFKKYLKIV
jgi:UDP-N-acetylmuramyl pentapeptide phosphotransferase/UDP-N-acetylglucosamine-1-phosphate transferase